MKSGIYLLQFSSGKFYIGKSLNIWERWAQHRQKFETKTHTKLLQKEFDSSSLPTCTVLSHCHPDLLDLLERYWFNSLTNQNCLNSIALAKLTSREISLLEDFQHCFNLGIVDLLETISSQEHSVEELGVQLEKEISKNKSRQDLLELTSKNTQLKMLVTLLESELAQTKLPWYKKLYNKLPYKK